MVLLEGISTKNKIGHHVFGVVFPLFKTRRELDVQVSTLGASKGSIALANGMKQSKTLLSKHIGLLKDVFAELIEDWSSKKSSKVHALLFDDVVTRVVPAQGGSSDLSSSHSVVLPGTAASLVLGGIVTAMGAGRSDYVKSEAFRVGSKFFQDTTSVVDNAAVRKACEACGEMVAFEGGAGLKSKRIKDVLAVLEKIVNHGKTTEAKKGFWNVLGERMTKGLTDASTSSQRQCEEPLQEVHYRDRGMGMQR